VARTPREAESQEFERLADDSLSGSGFGKEPRIDMGQIAKSDAELVEASRRGEREAFGHLVTRYQDVVCAVSYSSTQNWALSEDVAQETFIAAWRQLGQLRETGRIRSWLCGIARNLARKARKRTDREEVVVEDELIADGSPFDVTAQAEVDRVVREALARIPDRYRETLVLYYCEHQSIREVAETLGIAENAAMQRLSRGRKYLADSVTGIVERSLRGPRPRKNLAAAVVAALPTIALPSRVDASPKGSTMLKIGIAAAVLTAGTATAVIAHEVRTPDEPPRAKAQVVANAAPAPSPGPAAPRAAVAPAMPTGPDEDGVPPGAIKIDDSLAKVVDKQTIERLGLDRGGTRGPADAPVTIIVFQDLLCTYCGTVLGTIDQLWEEYPQKLRLVVKQFPVHKEATLAAEASLAADAQGKFWEMHDYMFAHQEDLTRDALVAYAERAGLDAKKMAQDLDKHTYADDLEKEVAAAKEAGVRATPQFLINGKQFTGARPVEAFRAAIDEALATAGASD
jgi:RNA polymerase sigma factor (sigma-70 family)